MSLNETIKPLLPAKEMERKGKIYVARLFEEDVLLERRKTLEGPYEVSYLQKTNGPEPSEVTQRSLLSN